MRKFFVTMFLFSCANKAIDGYDFYNISQKQDLFYSGIEQNRVIEIFGEPSFKSLDGDKLYYFGREGDYHSTFRFQSKKNTLLTIECSFEKCYNISKKQNQ